MGNNILSAILNISNFKNNDLKDYSTKYLIRINAVGEQLEYYMQDAIAGTFTKKLEDKKEIYSKVFSYLGNQNNPPDLIIKKGDAIEVKKIENKSSNIALNSSPPKDLLHSDDIRITTECRNCEGEEWKEKDLFYTVGYVKNKLIKYLFLIQGTCFSANREIYERIHEPLKADINELIKEKGLESGKTKELGAVKRVDPLGITNLRVRGMWHIQNPLSVYTDICSYGGDKNFVLFVLMLSEKYMSFPKEDRDKIESKKEIFVEDIKIKNPNNPAKLLNAKLITFSF